METEKFLKVFQATLDAIESQQMTIKQLTGKIRKLENEITQIKKAIA